MIPTRVGKSLCHHLIIMAGLSQVIYLGTFPFRVKGKGEVLTHWLIGTREGAVQRRNIEGPAQAPLFCRPSVMPNSNGSVGNMSADLRKKSPRLMHRADSVLARRDSKDSRSANANGGGSGGGGRFSSLTGQNLKLHNHAMSNAYVEPSDFLVERSRTSSACSSPSTISPPSMVRICKVFFC